MRTLYALIIVILKSPFMLLGYLAKNKLLLVILIIAGGIFFGYRTFINNTRPTDIPDYAIKTPTVNEAPYILQTSSRIYYISNYTDDGNVLILKDWYSFDSKVWEKNASPLVINRDIYGPVKISVR